jgi:hypothetical protein
MTSVVIAWLYNKLCVKLGVGGQLCRFSSTPLFAPCTSSAASGRGLEPAATATSRRSTDSANWQRSLLLVIDQMVVRHRAVIRLEQLGMLCLCHTFIGRIISERGLSMCVCMFVSVYVVTSIARAIAFCSCSYADIGRYMNK